MSNRDTIFALSSGGLPSGVAVIRLSGRQAFSIGTSLVRDLPPPRLSSLRTIRTRNGDILDHGIVIPFAGPASFTGEDCLELHLHGGRATVKAVLDELASFPGARHADAGEFSRRAFLNGKLDLVEIEGLADLISAETEMQRRLASEQARGILSSLYTGWAQRLTHARAMIEAELDFADEEDVPGSVSAGIWEDMSALQMEIDHHLAAGHAAEIIRDGLHVVIIGAPNAGKSSLLNALARREAAIVTSVPGTTRDIISVDFSLAGFLVKLVDTAGLRETDDVVEQEGIRRAREAALSAHLILLLSETSDGFLRIEDASAPIVRVATKIDQRRDSWNTDPTVIGISTITGQGMENLVARLEDALPSLSGMESFSLPSRERQRDHLRQVSDAIRRSLIARQLDLQAEHLRQAAHAIGRITGKVDVEDLLDVIFSEFCIGK